MERYIKNMNMLSKEENKNLKDTKVCVIGCGGLGGYVIEMLGRLGIGYITIVDGDIFDVTNLNRQIFSNIENLGEKKVKAAQQRMERVNPSITINSIHTKLNLQNGDSIIEGHDVIVDAVDNLESRFIIKEIAERFKIPLVHGAIGGWYGQVTTIFPGDSILDRLYPNRKVKGIEKDLGNPSFTPSLVASIQVSEVLKILLERGELLRNKVLYLDLLEHDYTIINFDY